MDSAGSPGGKTLAAGTTARPAGGIPGRTGASAATPTVDRATLPRNEAMIAMDLSRDLLPTEVLADHRELLASHLAMIDGRTRLTNRELADRVRALAAALRALGLGVGDRLLWLGAGSSRLLECLLAAMRVGAVLCPVVAGRSREQLGRIMADCMPSVVLSDAAHLDAVAANPDALRGAIHIRHDGADDYDTLVRRHRNTPLDEVELPGDTPALMLYTPMVAGRPVGMQVTRSALIAESADRELRGSTGRAHRRTVLGPLDEIPAVVDALSAVLAGVTVEFPASPPFRPSATRSAIRELSVPPARVPTQPTDDHRRQDTGESATNR